MARVTRPSRENTSVQFVAALFEHYWYWSLSPLLSIYPCPQTYPLHLVLTCSHICILSLSVFGDWSGNSNTALSSKYRDEKRLQNSFPLTFPPFPPPSEVIYISVSEHAKLLCKDRLFTHMCAQIRWRRLQKIHEIAKF